MPIYMGVFEKPNVLDRKFRGQVKAKGYEGWIELQSAQVGTNRGTAGQTGPGANRQAQPAIREIVISKLQDAVSNALFRETLDGEEKLIVIAFVKGDGTTYMTIVLQDTLFSSYNLSGGDHSTPLESFSLNFTKITYQMSPNSPDTTHSRSYDLSTQAIWDNYP